MAKITPIFLTYKIISNEEAEKGSEIYKDIKCSILPVLRPAAAVLVEGLSSLGTSFCMSAWPNSHPGGKLQKNNNNFVSASRQPSSSIFFFRMEVYGSP